MPLNRDDRSLWLWSEQPPYSDPADNFRPWLELYLLPADRPRGAVLVCPGGGYVTRAPHEAEPIARRFNRAGFHALVVQYRVAPHRHPAPLLDAAQAVRLIRRHAADWQIDPARIAVCGFSAGGHLAASLGVHWDKGCASPDGLPQPDCRPDALILCYPVITSGEWAHRGSFQNLLGNDASPDMLQFMSLEQQVNAQTPPAFLWHTVADAGVPVENSLLFVQALRRHGVPFELHFYPEGRHGLGLAPEDAHVATWADLCCGWLEGMGW